MHFDHDLDEPLPFLNKSSFAVRGLEPEDKVVTSHVAIQTESMEENPAEIRGLKEAYLFPSKLNYFSGESISPVVVMKDQFLNNDPLFFDACDNHVEVVSRKWYKSLRKLVKHLTEIVDDFPIYAVRKDLVTVRAFYVWISNNMM